MATKSHKSRLAGVHRAIAKAVRDHKDKDGLVRLYPTEPAGDVRVPGVPAVVMDVEPARALHLLSFRPPAFTLYESRNPLAEHAELDALEHEQAWGASDSDDAEDEPGLPEESPPEQDENAGDGESQEA